MFEIRRQIFHLLFGLAIVALLMFNVISIFGLFILFTVGFFLAVLSVRMDVPFIKIMLDWFERPSARHTVPGKGALLLVLGAILVLAWFPKDIALASIAILAVGDSIATIVGKVDSAVPHPLNTKKMLEGSLLGFFCSFLVAMIFIAPLEAFFAAFIAMAFEAVEVKMYNKMSIDDNILIPLIAGLVVFLMRTL